MTDAGIGVTPDLEGVLGHKANGAGDPARAFVLAFDGVVMANRLWSGHSRIMGRFERATGSVRIGGDPTALGAGILAR